MARDSGRLSEYATSPEVQKSIVIFISIVIVVIITIIISRIVTIIINIIMFAVFIIDTGTSASDSGLLL